MARSAVLRHEQGYLSTLPLGSIVAWHRDLDSDRKAVLPPGWAECNGQTLDDSESPYHNQVIPNLNGDAGAGDGGLFLRGNLRSGDLQADQMQSHTHKEDGEGHRHPAHESVNDFWGGAGTENRVGEGGGGWRFLGAPTTGPRGVTLGDPVATTAGTPQHGDETRPVNMSVIWIMKVKHITAARAVPAVQADANAPLGAVYVGRSGNVGIGTSTPAAALEVRGDVRADNMLSAETFTALLTNGGELESSTAEAAPVLYTQVEQNTAPDVFEMQQGGVLVIRRAGIVSISACITVGTHEGKNGELLVSTSGGGGAYGYCPIPAFPAYPRSTLRCHLYRKVGIDETVTFQTIPVWIHYVGSGLGWSGPSAQSYLTVLWIGVR